MGKQGKGRKVNKGGHPVLYTFDMIYEDTIGFIETLRNQSIKEWTISFSELVAPRPYSRDTYYELFRKFTSEEYLQENQELTEKIKKLSDSKKKIMEILEQRLVRNASENKYNAVFTIFNLKNNYGWKDKNETDLHTKGDIKIVWEDESAKKSE